MFGTFKLTVNADLNKYEFSGYGTAFDASGSFALSDGSGFGKKVIIIGADMTSAVHIDNTKKDILIHGKSSTQVIDDTILTTEKEYSINFTEIFNC